MGRCGWTHTLVHELSETVVALDEIIEPLLNLLSIPEEGFTLWKGFFLRFYAIEECFEPPEPELE